MLNNILLILGATLVVLIIYGIMTPSDNQLKYMRVDVYHALRIAKFLIIFLIVVALGLLSYENNGFYYLVFNYVLLGFNIGCVSKWLI